MYIIYKIIWHKKQTKKKVEVLQTNIQVKNYDIMRSKTFSKYM